MTRFDLWSRYVAHSKQPILLGPWREEIGSEVLYWLPWLAQWRHQYGIAKDRLIAISRGGAAVWYDAAKQVELYDYWPLDVCRLETQRSAKAQQSVKQLRMTELERLLYPLVAARLGLRRYHVLHPSAMYAQIRGWHAEEVGLATIVKTLRFTPLPMVTLPLGLTVPERCVCVRFYERHTWPFSEEIRDYCTQLVAELAKRLPVVILGSGAHHDDHLDLNITGPNITSLVDAFPLRENLALQAAVIAKSQVFVGTYGGTMQLAVRLGKPSAGFYQHFKGTAFAHQTLTRWVALQQQTPLFIGSPADGELARSVINQALELPTQAGSSSGVTG